MAEAESSNVNGLRGVSCSCGFRTAIPTLLCPRCGRKDLKEVALVPGGQVISFTVVNAPTPDFSLEVPFAYALIDLDDGTRVSGWLPEVKRREDLEVGDRVSWMPSKRSRWAFRKEKLKP